ncbi:MAG: rRNA methyltransferase [Desulfurococcales archaeon]|nr:rRNA methyltransferase [Desulfurococcales archaeon]
MDKLRLVLVEVEGAINLGMIARLAENFEVDELYLVNPKASLEEAREYAVRAAHRLDSARIVSSLDEALRGASLSVCTSARSSERDPLRVAVPPRSAAELAAGIEGVVALVMGRESVGLTRRELEKCHILSSIPSSPRYPALNLANATAIYLYELYLARRGSPKSLGNVKYARLVEAYARALSRVLIGDEKRRNDVIVGLRRLAVLNLERERDVKLLLYLLSRACNRIEGCSVEVPPDV